MMQTQIFSIGHSNHSIDKFISLLEGSEINMVVDVRSAPFSRMFPQFNQEALKKSLSDNSIGYLFLGDQIGGRSNDPDDYLDGQVIYKSLANKETFKTGIERLKEGSARYQIALMCSEKEPLDCHRTLLVSETLVNSDIVVHHIHFVPIAFAGVVYKKVLIFEQHITGFYIKRHARTYSSAQTSVPPKWRPGIAQIYICK